MDIAKRRQNERKFGTWRELPDGGRLHSYEVKGRSGWLAKYVKEVDKEESTVRFYRRSSREVPGGSRPPERLWRGNMITRDTVASQLRDYLQRRTTRAALVDWAERAMMEQDFDDRDLDTIRDITSRLGLADVRDFGLTWEDCEGFLSRLGYKTKVDVVQAS